MIAAARWTPEERELVDDVLRSSIPLILARRARSSRTGVHAIRIAGVAWFASGRLGDIAWGRTASAAVAQLAPRNFKQARRTPERNGRDAWVDSLLQTRI